MRVKAWRHTAMGVIASAGMVVGAPAVASTATTSTTAPSTSTTTAPAGTAPFFTPILSVRRLPGWIEASDAGRQIAAGLRPIMAKLGPAAKHSCVDVTQDGIPIASVHATESVTPASNLKLLTAAAALDRLGPNSRIRTAVVRTGRVVHGVLHGDLYLVGGGDPLLRTPVANYLPDQDLPEPHTTSLVRLAALVRAAGIKRVEGSVIGDGSLFDSETTVSGWNADYSEDDDVGPIGALDVNDGFTPKKPWGAAKQPARMSAQAFQALLTKDGITVTTKYAGQGTAPRRARRVTSILSAPLSAELFTILQVSDDTGAEILTKLLGARFGGAGTTAAGVRVIKETLAKQGLPVGGLHMVDGSGLAVGDRVTCQLVVDVLQQAGSSGALFDGLPVAAKTGTLFNRLNGTPAAGRVHAKTGTLDSVSSLSGFVMPAKGAKASTAQTGAPLAFSFISSDLPGDWLGIQVGDEVATYLAGVKTKVPPLSAASPLTDG